MIQQIVRRESITLASVENREHSLTLFWRPSLGKLKAIRENHHSAFKIDYSSKCAWRSKGPVAVQLATVPILSPLQISNEAYPTIVILSIICFLFPELKYDF